LKHEVATLRIILDGATITTTSSDDNFKVERGGALKFSAIKYGVSYIFLRGICVIGCFGYVKHEFI
jgi:hypothetical protein